MASNYNITMKQYNGTDYDVLYPKTVIGQVDGAASTATYNVNVTETWTEDTVNGGYTQTVAVAGILSTDNPIADVILGSDIEANATYLEAWSCVTRITTSDDSITLYANGDAPTSAFTCQLKVVRS